MNIDSTYDVRFAFQSIGVVRKITNLKPYLPVPHVHPWKNLLREVDSIIKAGWLAGYPFTYVVVVVHWDGIWSLRNSGDSKPQRSFTGSRYPLFHATPHRLVLAVNPQIGQKKEKRNRKPRNCSWHFARLLSALETHKQGDWEFRIFDAHPKIRVFHVSTTSLTASGLPETYRWDTGVGDPCLYHDDPGEQDSQPDNNKLS